MKVNKGRAESLIVLTFIISSVIITPILISLVNSSIYNLNFNQNQNHDIEDNLKKDPPPIPTSSNSPPNAHYFNFYKKITIDSGKVSGSNDLVDFPLLVSILDSDLRVQVQSNGNDIAFSNGTDWLDHEIELFEQDYNPRYAKLVAWVRIPLLSGSEDTVIYMYYGNSTMTSQQNPTDVWDNNYVGVWHLNEDPTGTIYDSTSNNNDGTSSGMNADDLVAGAIGKGLDFDGSNDFIQTTSNEIKTSSDITIEAWFNADSTSMGHIVWQGDSYYDEDYADGGGAHDEINIGTGDCTDGDSNEISIFLEGDDNDIDVAPNFYDTTNFHYLVGVFSNIESSPIGELFLDGISQGSDSADSISRLRWDTDLRIGRPYRDVRYFDGVLDEIRVSVVDRSAEWIATQYENQYDSYSFYSISGRYEVNPPKTEDFNFYKEITINHNNISGTTDLIDFPLMLSIIDADLHDKVQSDGDDIAFWNGSEWLHHEIEYFSQNYNAYYAKLVAWVRIPTLSWDKDTTLYMYYGNPAMTSRQDPSGVWGKDYQAIWHLDESSGTDAYIKDSSSRFHDGTPTGTQFLSTGKIDGARDFIGDGNNRIEVDRGSEILDGDDRFSFSFWLYPNYASDTEWENAGERQVFYKSSSVLLNRIWRNSLWSAGEGQFQPDIDFVIHPTTYLGVTIHRQEWNYITYTYDGNDLNAYVNGQLESSDNIGTDRIEADRSLFRLGTFNTIKGYLDDFRVMKDSRSGDWIETEYNNQYNPIEFYTVSQGYKAHVPSNNDFEYYKEISVDSDYVAGTNDLIDFPLLISIIDSDLKNDAQLDGDDIIFSNGTEWLDHEIELYNPNYDVTNAQLIAWVRIPILHTSIDTKIYMLYGNSTVQSLENPSGVWDNGYKGIYHLKGNPTQVFLDSTSNNNYGITGGSMISTDQVSAKINGGIDFDGNDDYFSVSDPLETAATNDMTISAWIFLKDASENWISLAQRSNTAENGFDWQIYARADDATPQYHSVYRTYGGASEVVSNITLQTINWYYLVGTNNGTHNFFYLNGFLTDISEETNSISDSNNDIWFGGNSVWGEYFHGIIDEVRISNMTRSSDWVLTEYRNQNNPDTFYSVGTELTGFGNVGAIQVNAIDLYDNSIPSVNISILQNNEILHSELADISGSVLFTNLLYSEFNFTVEITSNIQPYQVETINRTFEAISINSPFKNITLRCNISRNIFYLEDLDGNPLDTGWIIVSKDSHNLQNYTIDDTGYATSRWLNTSGYHYTVWYQDNNFNPNKIVIASGEIFTPNSRINLIVNLVTVNFTTWTIGQTEVMSGVKLLFSNTSSGKSIVNLTTDLDGIATFRWLNTSTSYNYSLTIRFYGYPPDFQIVQLATGFVPTYNFSIKSSTTYDIEIQIQGQIEDYETTVLTLNPKDSIVLEWGFNLTLRALFNVTKAPPPTELGPIYADSMWYEIYYGSTLVASGSMSKEWAYIGRHHCTIGTYNLQPEILYTILIKAYKSEYVVPQEEQISLYLLKNDLILNQSENDDSLQTVYWSEIAEMSVKSYSEVSEELILEDNINYIDVGSNNYNFQFSIPDLSTDWNLSQIVFNVYGVEFGVAEQDINLNFSGPYGISYKWNQINAGYYYPSGDTGNGAWYDLTIPLNKESPSNDNIFNFTIDGTFVGTIQINAEAIFRRDRINAEYYKSNITNAILIPSDGNGWVIKNITFEIINCQDLTGTPLNPVDCIKNITTNEGYVIDVNSGKTTIDDKIIYPLDDQFLFTIGNNTAIIFDVRIEIEYIQEFYKNNYLEVVSYSKTVNGFTSGNFSIGLTEEDLNDQGAILFVSNLKEGSNPIYPSEVAMNITILGQTIDVSDNPKRGSGTFMLENIMGFNKNIIYSAIIRTNQPTTFMLSFMIMYSRTAVYEIEGILTYEIEGTGVSDTVPLDQNLGIYSQNINTSLIFARYEPYTIKFTLTKDNYNPTTKELDIEVLERLTLISGSSNDLLQYPIIYVQDEIIYSFSYTDAQHFTDILDLETQTYTITKIGTDGIYRSGSLSVDTNNEYSLDINTRSLSVGSYSIWVKLDKQNYGSKDVIITLTVNEREINYDLGDMFEEKQTNVVKGETITLSIELTDPTKGDIPLKGAQVILEIDDDEFDFEEVKDGIYELEFETDDYEAFFTSSTITGTIKISKANYTTKDVDITIIIEIEEIEVIPGEPGIPVFYLLLLIAVIGAVVGSLSTYKYIQIAKIPKFVKKTRVMKKAIKAGDEVSNSLLTASKEETILKQFNSDWEEIGISLKEILGIKSKKENILSGEEGGGK